MTDISISNELRGEMIVSLWNRIKCFLGVHTWVLVQYDSAPASCGLVERIECKYCGPKYK